MGNKLIFFYVSDSDTPVLVNSELWNTPLPVAIQNKSDAAEDAVSLGDYFTAAESFLGRDDFLVVKSAVRQVDDTNLETADVDRIDIYLVKHGQLYHPAKIEITFFKKTLSFVLNLAVSEAGGGCVEREFPALQKLCHKSPDIPNVYEKGVVAVEGRPPFSMFLAKWFDGYKEFHISYDDGVKKVIVWDYEQGFYYLSQDEAFQLYRKASAIMTSCYNIETFEQIQPWHHAAGDFVVKKNDDGVDVKLITVRQYTSLFENTFDDEESLLEAELIFLVGLSIRMRLDRIDGVEESVWSEDFLVGAVLTGFFETLITQKTPGAVDRDRSVTFKKYLLRIEPETINDFSMMILGSYHPESSDYLVVSDNISAHIALLELEIKKVVEC